MANQLFSTPPSTLQSDNYAIVTDELWDGTSEISIKNLAVIIKGEIIQDVISADMLPDNIPQLSCQVALYYPD